MALIEVQIHKTYTKKNKKKQTSMTIAIYIAHSTALAFNPMDTKTCCVLN